MVNNHKLWLTTISYGCYNGTMIFAGSMREETAYNDGQLTMVWSGYVGYGEIIFNGESSCVGSDFLPG